MSRSMLAMLVVVALGGSGFAQPQSVGLGLYVSNRAWAPDGDPWSIGQYTIADGLHVVDGTPRYLQEVELKAKIAVAAGAPDQMVMALATSTSDFGQLDWRGLEQVPANESGDHWAPDAATGVGYRHIVYFRGAQWMTLPSAIVVLPVDDLGRPQIGCGHAPQDFDDAVGISQECAASPSLYSPLVGFAGPSTPWLPNIDDWGLRMPAARVVAHGCPSVGDCSGATWYAEAAFAAKDALHPDRRAVLISPTATAVLIYWTADPQHVRRVPLIHDAPSTNYGFGFKIAADVLNPPARGYFLPGEAVQMRVSYFDSAGNRLFPAGSLPSYGDGMHGTPASAGLRYLIFTDDIERGWWGDWHQHDHTIAFGGPVDRMQQLGTVPITFGTLFLPQIPTADLANDGWNGFVQILPQTWIAFPCLSGETTACNAPASDTFSWTVPAEAQPGTWVATVKARREWEGEPRQAATAVNVQVGTPSPTQYAVQVHGCERCHTGQLAINLIHHGFTSPGAHCKLCHTDDYQVIGIYDAALDYRAHDHALYPFFKSMGGDINDCLSCHDVMPTSPLRF